MVYKKIPQTFKISTAKQVAANNRPWLRLWTRHTSHERRPTGARQSSINQTINLQRNLILPNSHCSVCVQTFWWQLLPFRRSIWLLNLHHFLLDLISPGASISLVQLHHMLSSHRWKRIEMEGFRFLFVKQLLLPPLYFFVILTPMTFDILLTSRYFNRQFIIILCCV